MTDLERKIKFLGKSKSLAAWEARKRKGWIEDEGFDERVDRLYRVKMRSLGLDPLGPIPLFGIPEDLGDPATGILVGNPVHEDRMMPPLFLSIEDLTKSHVGFWGITTFGKTFQVANLINEVSKKKPNHSFLCYDLQSELAGILTNLLPPEKLLWIRAEDYWKNPLQEIYEHGLDKAAGNLKRALLRALYVGSPTVNLLEMIIRRRCTAENLASLGPPTLKEMLHSAKNLDLGHGKGMAASRKFFEYQHSLINALGSLSLNLDQIYNQPISKGFTFRDLEGFVTVVDISSIKDPITIQFLIEKELIELTAYAEEPHPALTVVLDEVHRIAPIEKGYGQYSHPVLVDATKTILKRVVNFWWAEQNPGTMLNQAMFANTGTHFVYRLPSLKDRWPVLYAINVSDKEREEAVGMFEKRHCLVYSNSLGAAVLIRTPDLDIRDLREEASNRSAPIIEGFHERFLSESPKPRVAEGGERAAAESEEAAGQRPQSVQDLTKKKIADHRVDHPLSGITETYVAVGISPEIGKRHLKEMLDLGWLEGPERMPGPGKSHKTNDCYAVTEKGCQALGFHWREARLPGKGSLKSRLAARMIGLKLERQGKVVRYEHALSNGEITKSADVAVLEGDGPGRVKAFEYENTSASVIANITRNARAGFCGTVVVCPNARASTQARKVVDRELDPGLRGKVSFAMLKEFA